MDDVATLLDQGIDVSVINKLIKNNADLRDIAVHSQILLDGGIRVDLVNEWLGNETHLNSAIAIINRGVDLNLIGTSSKVGDFTDLMGAHPNEIVSRIPADAKIERWKPNPAKVQEGMKFRWLDAFNDTHIPIEGRIDWDVLASSLSSLGKGDLEYALGLLGLSGQIRYLPILNEYARHADPEIREWAEDAINEIEYRVAHASSPRKAS